MKRALFQIDAEAELAEAEAHYEQISTDLAARFVEEMQQLVDDIEVAPHAYSIWRHGARRHFSLRFPYAVIYVERATCLGVVAVAHLKRRPGYWKDRIRL